MPTKRPDNVRVPVPGRIRQIASILYNAEDRQRVLDELCKRALNDFVGRRVTPYSIAQAEHEIRSMLDDAVRAGVYVVPDGLKFSRVELGSNGHLKVFFDRTDDQLPYYKQEFSIDEPTSNKTDESKDALNGRFEALAAELDYMKKMKED